MLQRFKIWEEQKSNIMTPWENIGDGVVIHSHCWIGKDVRIGKNVKIQAFTFIPDGVEIEDDVFIGPRVTFTNDRELNTKGKEFWKKTIVKKGAKLGASVTIVAGVTIGEGAKIGAGAVVVNDIPAGDDWWVGVPAKKLIK